MQQTTFRLFVCIQQTDSLYIINQTPFLSFWKKSFTKAAFIDDKYSKNSIIVKYYYNSK